MAKKNFVGPKGARLLRRVAKHILAEPRRYNQNEVVCRLATSVKGPHVPSCRTVACIGGWLLVLTSKKPVRSLEGLPFRKLSGLVGVSIQSLFRLTAYTFNAGGDGWPEKYRKAYVIAKRQKTRANIAAERIEHFIKTGE